MLAIERNVRAQAQRAPRSTEAAAQARLEIERLLEVHADDDGVCGEIGEEKVAK